MEHVSQTDVAHVPGATGREVNGPPKAFYGVVRVPSDSPIEGSNVEESPVGPVL